MTTATLNTAGRDPWQDEPLSAAPIEPSHLDRARRLGRIGAWVLIAGLAGLLAWAALAPLDEGVPAPASVMLDTKRKPVQHLAGGIVKTVLVREGDHVTQGQPLIELDAEVARANYEAVRQHYLGLRVAQARLVAERTGESSIRFHEDVKAAAADPQVQAQINAQQQLFAIRKSGLQAELQSIDESVEGHKGSLEAFRTMLASRKEQVTLLKEELEQTRSLVQEGYAPRNRQLELERMVSDAHSAIAELQGNIVRTTRSINELSQRAQLRRSDYGKELGTQLADVLRDVEAEAQKFRAAQQELSRMEIRSPATGQVVGTIAQTVGAVIQPAQKLMDIVPQGESLLLEARVPPHLIDRIRPALAVDARFASFAHSPHLVVEGRVETVSGDLLTDPQTNVSYYLARVAVTPEGRKALGKRELQPGMPCELVFKTGERSLLTYLLHPLVKRVAASMKEE